MDLAVSHHTPAGYIRSTRPTASTNITAMNSLVDELSSTMRSAGRCHELRCHLARVIEHKGRTLNTSKPTPRIIRDYITQRVSIFFVLWACRYARSHPKQWAAWKADPSNPKFLAHFDPGPDLNFPKSIVPRPDTACLLVLLYLGELYNILNLSDPGKELFNINQFCGDKTAHLLNLDAELPLRNTRVTPHFTSEWANVIEKISSNPLQGLLGNGWDKYKESARLDLEALASNSEPPKHRARRTPARVLGLVLRTFSLPIIVRNCTSRNSQKTSFNTQVFFEATSLIMCLQEYHGENHLMFLIEDLMPQFVPAVAKSYWVSTRTPVELTQPVARSLVGAEYQCSSTMKDHLYNDAVSEVMYRKYGLSAEACRHQFSRTDPNARINILDNPNYSIDPSLENRSERKHHPPLFSLFGQKVHSGTHNVKDTVNTKPVVDDASNEKHGSPAREHKPPCFSLPDREKRSSRHSINDSATVNKAFVDDKKNLHKYLNRDEQPHIPSPSILERGSGPSNVNNCATITNTLGDDNERPHLSLPPGLEVHSGLQRANDSVNTNDNNLDEEISGKKLVESSANLDHSQQMQLSVIATPHDEERSCTLNISDSANVRFTVSTEETRNQSLSPAILRFEISKTDVTSTDPAVVHIKVGSLITQNPDSTFSVNAAGRRPKFNAKPVDRMRRNLKRGLANPDITRLLRRKHFACTRYFRRRWRNTEV